MSTTTATQEQLAAENYLFTCLSCSIAFPSAEDQRTHYRSDHHRYNMKRRVAGLPPVSATVFNQKVLDRKTETAVMSSTRGSVCAVCDKAYTTENAYRSHINSKKHKENELKAAVARVRSEDRAEDAAVEASLAEPPIAVPADDEVPSAPVLEDTAAAATPAPAAAGAPKEVPGASLAVDADADEDAVNDTIDAKIAAARSRLSPAHCLFCPSVSADGLGGNLAHMSAAHSFFVPDAEYLTDLPGLLAYLGEKVAVGNVCVFCNGRGREFRTLHAVRKHMLDKGHTKLAYEAERDRLELACFYDFSASYPDAALARERREARRAARKAAKALKPVKEEDAEWEEIDDDGASADEVVEESASGSEQADSDDDDSDSDDDDDELPGTQVTYGDSPFELVLASGARIGHRTLKRYYDQNLHTRYVKPDDPNSGRALVKRLIADRDGTLVPRRGGFGAFGAGTDVVKARNRGEAREAGRHTREFRDRARKDAYFTRVGFKHNNQKHFRDPNMPGM